MRAMTSPSEPHPLPASRRPEPEPTNVETDATYNSANEDASPSDSLPNVDAHLDGIEPARAPLREVTVDGPIPRRPLQPPREDLEPPTRRRVPVTSASTPASATSTVVSPYFSNTIG